jgi:hypothetical protein
MIYFLQFGKWDTFKHWCTKRYKTQGMLSYKVLLRFQKNSVSKDIDSIYLLFYHFDNEFYKKTKILHISLLFLWFWALAIKKKKIELNDAQLPKSTLPVMKP